MKFLLFVFLLVFSFLSFSGERVITTAPNLTNIVKALGAEKLIVGKTNYCKTEKGIPITGTLYNFNFERAVSLKPSVVFAPKTQNEQILKKFEKLNLKVESFEFESLSQIKDSILKAGRILNASKIAKELVQKMRRVKKTKRDSEALFIVSLQVQNSKIKDMYVAANGSLYEEILSYNGLKVPFTNSKMTYIRINLEKLMLINPKYIFFLSTIEREKSDLAAFKRIKLLKANKENNVFSITEENMMTPDHNIVKLIDIVERKIND